MPRLLTLFILIIFSLPAIATARTQSSNDDACSPDSLVTHFWDAYDFADAQFGQSYPAVKKAITEFVALFSGSSEQARLIGASHLYRSAAVNPEAMQNVSEIIEEEIGNQLGSLYDEAAFRTFMKACAGIETLPDWQRERAEYLLTMTTKNLPGSYAADFGMVLREGGAAALYRLLDPERLNLLIFYNPFCEECHEVKQEIADNPTFDDINIIAVADGPSYDTWMERANEMPQRWHVGFTNGQIDEKAPYYITLIPALYLLDQKGIVILKDATLEQLINYISASWKK